jgi:hypothetical protein
MGGTGGGGGNGLGVEGEPGLLRLNVYERTLFERATWLSPLSWRSDSGGGGGRSRIGLKVIEIGVEG